MEQSDSQTPASSTTATQATYDATDLTHATESYATAQVIANPDGHWHYSNAGMNLVGRLIEVVSGQSYADFVHKQLLHPLGMLDTTIFPSREQLQRLAKSYTSGERMREVPIDTSDNVRSVPALPP